jgi:glutamate-1-semialdehyde 2,1-aminomutase
LKQFVYEDDQLKIKGQTLWERAKKIIPGGNQLLSKRSERFLPGLWPAYYKKAKGCEVWALDGSRYYDFAQMGVGSCVLGYADDEVNAAVMEAIGNGSMCSLNSHEEMELAEKLVGLHPWADMVRFARTGGEACAIAVRIARAATRRSKVAFCGYHGWHDWYLAANLGDDSGLDQHLLAGLVPAGVPSELRKTALPFSYNRLDELEAIAREHGDDLGVIIMEPQRSVAPDEGFLEGVRQIADRTAAVLIFDEITSGFRMNLGGIHLTGEVIPDIVLFGKALGNGFPISAIVGRRKFMEYAQESFISSTFWTERIGFTAAIATLQKMESCRVQDDLVAYGKRINQGWEQLADKHGLKIHISGIPPLTHLSFVQDNPLVLQTLYAQEMLARGYLVGAAVYTTYAYSAEIIDKFIADSDQAFAIIKKAIDSREATGFLKGDIIQTGFKRLT